jgi:hypothetical protein
VKRRVVVTGVVLFALWPAVHRGIVAAYDANPWKLAGWAMYARPHFPSQVELKRLRGGQLLPVELTAWERTLVEEFVDRRSTLGELASPESVAREVLDRHEGDDAVVVEIRTRFFDLESARILERQKHRVYRR